MVRRTRSALVAADVPRLVGGVRRRGVRRPTGSSGKGMPFAPLWPWRAQAGVVACTVAAAGISVFVIVQGMGGLHTHPAGLGRGVARQQHPLDRRHRRGRAVRAGQLNWYESSTGMYYPNAYHLVAALVYQRVRQLRGRGAELADDPPAGAGGAVGGGGRAPVRWPAVVAGLSALLIVSTAAFYDNLWRGPLLPFSTGLALTPIAVILVADLLDAEGLRARLRPGLVLVLGIRRADLRALVHRVRCGAVRAAHAGRALGEDPEAGCFASSVRSRWAVSRSARSRRSSCSGCSPAARCRRRRLAGQRNREPGRRRRADVGARAARTRSGGSASR